MIEKLILAVCIAYSAGFISFALLNMYYEHDTYKGMTAKDWFGVYTIQSENYMEILNCTQRYDQCGYVVDTCMIETGNEDIK